MPMYINFCFVFFLSYFVSFMGMILQEERKERAKEDVREEKRKLREEERAEKKRLKEEERERVRAEREKLPGIQSYSKVA